MHTNIRRIRKLLVVAMMASATSSAYADVVTDWNVKAGDIVVAAKLPPDGRSRQFATATSMVTPDRARCFLVAVYRYPCAPGVPMRSLHRRGDPWCRSQG